MSSLPETLVHFRTDLEEAIGREQAARLRQGRRRQRLVALAAGILVIGLLVTPAFGLGDRLLSLIQGKPTRLDVQAPSWSHDGRTIVFVSWRDGNGEVYAMDADSSSPRNLTQNPAEDVRPAWSPDGRRLVFVSQRDGNSEVYVMNADGSGKRNLTRDGASDDYPTWSPDGRRIAFLRGVSSYISLGVRRFHGYHLYVVNADGSGLRRLSLRVPEATPQTTAPYRGGQVVWSPDGRTIYFGRYLVRTDGSGARRLPYIPLTAVWSPDGTRIAFAGHKWLYSGAKPGPCCYAAHSDIYVMNADGSGTRKLTHNALQNAEPAWSPDGRKIAFRDLLVRDLS